jgi:hypothetical protein
MSKLDKTKLQFAGNNRDNLYVVPQRKIRPTRRSISGIYPFRRERLIQYESSLEQDFIVRMEFFSHVLDMVAQPVQLEFRNESKGRTYRYTPDFLVTYRTRHLGTYKYDRPRLVEVKPKDDWSKNWRKWLPKWKAARRYAIEQGWEFRIYDEDRIRDTALENIKQLAPFKRSDVDPEDAKIVLKLLDDMGVAPINYVLARYFGGNFRGRGLSLIWSLLANRAIDCDITVPLTESTEIWIPPHG